MIHYFTLDTAIETPWHNMWIAASNPANLTQLQDSFLITDMRMLARQVGVKDVAKLRFVEISEEGMQGIVSLSKERIGVHAKSLMHPPKDKMVMLSIKEMEENHLEVKIGFSNIPSKSEREQLLRILSHPLIMLDNPSSGLMRAVLHYTQDFSE